MIVRCVRVALAADAPEAVIEEWSVAPEVVPPEYKNDVAWVRANFHALFESNSVVGELTLTVGRELRSCILVGTLCSSIKAKIILVHDFIEYICEEAAKLCSRLREIGGVEQLVLSFKRTSRVFSDARELQQTEVA